MRGNRKGRVPQPDQSKPPGSEHYWYDFDQDRSDQRERSIQAIMARMGWSRARAEALQEGVPEADLPE